MNNNITLKLFYSFIFIILCEKQQKKSSSFARENRRKIPFHSNRVWISRTNSIFRPHIFESRIKASTMIALFHYLIYANFIVYFFSISLANVAVDSPFFGSAWIIDSWKQNVRRPFHYSKLFNRRLKWFCVCVYVPKGGFFSVQSKTRCEHRINEWHE